MPTLAASFSSVFKPRDTRPTAEWAQEKVSLFPPITRTGRLDLTHSRHFIPILDALDDERTREVNVLKPVRGGGSLIGDIHLINAMSRNAGPYMNVFQTEDEGGTYVHDRIEKQLHGNTCTAGLLPSKYDWHEIRLNNGHTIYNGGPAWSFLQSKSIRYLRLDECWMYPLGRMGEAEGRIGDYLKDEMSKVLRISQAGAHESRTLEDCEWNRAYHRGSIHEWEVSCIHCDKYFEPVFNGTRDDGTFFGLVWDQHKKPSGDWDLARCVPTVRFECPHCGKPSMDTGQTKAAWNRTGRYRLAGEEDSKRRVSFHYESVIDFPWVDLAELWLDASNAFLRGNLTPKLQFYQKRRAIFKDEASLMRGGMNFARSSYEVQSEWKEEKARAMTVDRQQEDLYWWTVRAWSDSESRRLGFGKCYGEGGIKEQQDKFKVPANRVLIDSAFLPKGDHGVYSMCCRNGWISVKGADLYEFPHKISRGGKVQIIRRSYSEPVKADPEIGRSGEGARFCNLIRFSKPQLNQKVQELIDSGRWKEPMEGETKEMEAEYQAQMASRIKVVEYDKRTNAPRILWKEGRNDHARDLANMQVLFAILLKLIPDPAADAMSTSEVKEDKPKE